MHEVGGRPAQNALPRDPGQTRTTAMRSLSTMNRRCGSINEVGWRFQSFRINDLEMVDLTGIEPVTS